MQAEPSPRRLRVLLLARQLIRAGAERQLVNLAVGLTDRGHDVRVLTIWPGGPLEDELTVKGIPVGNLARNRRQLALAAFRLVREIRSTRPNVIHTQLTLPNILVMVVRRWALGVPIVLGVRGTSPERTPGRLVNLVYRAEARLSRHAAASVVNSNAAAEWVISRGFPADRTHVIHNGIDTGRFRPDAEARRRVRAEWGVSENTLIVGRVAGLRPLKDYPTFLRAASLIAGTHEDVVFACVGSGPADEERSLQSLAKSLDLDGRIVWAGERDDVPRIMNACDVVVSSSTSESFPNVLAEAMACGVPCVTTDAGESALVVGDTGAVVSARAPAELAEAVTTLLSKRLERVNDIAERTRSRVAEMFSLPAMVKQTEDVLVLAASLL